MEVPGAPIGSMQIENEIVSETNPDYTLEKDSNIVERMNEGEIAFDPEFKFIPDKDMIILSEKENNRYREKSLLTIELEKCARIGLCTFQLTANNGWKQKYYQCEGCSIEGENGFCETCFLYCHDGHEGVKPSKKSPTCFFCTCEMCLCREKEYEPSINVDFYLQEKPVIDSHVSGKGQYFFKNGAHYMGEVKDGKMDGLGVLFGPTNTSNVKYEGQFRNNLMEGNGMFIQNMRGTLSTYIGEVKDNKANGIGKLYVSGNLVYEGKFKNGKYDGEGTRYYPHSSEKYLGMYRAGQEHGRGVFLYSNGSRYEGDYCAGKRTGKGILYYPDGRVFYEGDYENGKREGFGKLFKKKTGELYFGEFKDNLPHGRGRVQYSNKTEFCGMFVKGVREGLGKFTAGDGTTHEGQWKNNLKHGVFTITDPNTFGFFNNQRLSTFFNGEKATYQFLSFFSEVEQLKKKNLDYSLKIHGTKQHQSDKNFVISVLKHKGKDLQHVSEELKGDSDVVKIAIENCPSAIFHAHEKFRNEKLLVIEMVGINPQCLLHVNNKFMDDIDVLLTACRKDGLILRYISKMLQEKYTNERHQLVVEAVKQTGLALKFCKLFDVESEKYKIDPKMRKSHHELVLLAVKQNPNAIRYFSSKGQPLEFNEKLVIEATRRLKEIISMSHDFDAPPIEIDSLENVLEKKQRENMKEEEEEETENIISEERSSFQSLLSDDFERIKPILHDFSESLICSQVSWRKWVKDGIEKILSQVVIQEADMVKIREKVINHLKETSIPELFYSTLFVQEHVSKNDDDDQKQQNVLKNEHLVRKEMESVVEDVFDRHDIGNYETYLGFVFSDYITKIRNKKKNYNIQQQQQHQQKKMTSEERKSFRQGFGVVFYLFSNWNYWNKYHTVVVGNFENGKQNGDGKVFSKKTGLISFEGKFIDDQRHGSGREYTQSFGKFNIVHYEGMFSMDKRHGRGELYDLKSGKVQKGYWKENLLDPESVFTFQCPIIDYGKIEKHLKNTVILGSGAYGIVYKIKASAIPSIGIRKGFVAVKIMKCESRYSAELMFRMTKRGIGLCYSLESSHILAVYGIIRGRREVGYVMEICNTAVDKLIEASNGSMEMEEKIRILLGTARGMRDLHKKLVMHRDLKWPNVMMSGDTVEGRVVKITDFDTLKEDERKWRLQAVAGSSRIGTPGFLAPEVFMGKEYTLKCDIYAFGLMIYALLWEVQLPHATQYQCSCGNLVENILMANSLDYHVANCKLRPLLVRTEIRNYPTFLMDLMTSCWDADPYRRPSFAEIVQVFEGEIRKEKCYSVLVLQFPGFKSLRDQKMLLVQPKRSKIIEWVERNCKGSKVLCLTNKDTGEVLETDLQVLKLTQEVGSPIIQVQLNRLDEKICGDENLKTMSKKQLKEENEKLKSQNLDFIRQVQALKSENDELKRVVQDLYRKYGKKNVKKGGLGVEEEETEGEEDDN